jgi:hypothetical protein
MEAFLKITPDQSPRGVVKFLSIIPRYNDSKREYVIKLSYSTKASLEGS